MGASDWQMPALNERGNFMIKVDVINRRKSVLKGSPVILAAEMVIALKGLREVLLQMDPDEEKAKMMLAGVFNSVGMSNEEIKAATAKMQAEINNSK